MNEEFLSAPLWLQLALGGGYLGYLAAYSGLRDHHKQVDIAFLTIAFGLVSTGVFIATSALGSDFIAGGLAVATTVLAGYGWRMWGRDNLRKMHRDLGVSYSDDDPSPLAKLFSDRAHNVTQVQVEVSGDKRLFCEDTSQFQTAPFAPFTIGVDGSVTMYVTHVQKKGASGKWTTTKENEVRSDWGDRLTYIPAKAVVRVDLRYRPKS